MPQVAAIIGTAAALTSIGTNLYGMAKDKNPGQGPLPPLGANTNLAPVPGVSGLGLGNQAANFGATGIPGFNLGNFGQNINSPGFNGSGDFLNQLNKLSGNY